MLLVCNKKNKRKNDKDQLILGQKYVLLNNYSGQKQQGGNFISLPFKRSSSTDLFRICCPRTRTKAGDRTFTVTAARAWNKLPTLIKSANSLEIFKKLLKTHLFPKT